MQDIAGVKSHVGVNWGQSGVTLLSNSLLLPDLVGRTPDQSSALIGSKAMLGSAVVNQGSNCSGMLYGYQIWQEEPLTKV